LKKIAFQRQKSKEQIKSNFKNRSKNMFPEAALAAMFLRACLISLGGFAPKKYVHTAG
jgi:hypothetical protein